MVQPEEGVGRQPGDGADLTEQIDCKAESAGVRASEAEGVGRRVEGAVGVISTLSAAHRQAIEVTMAKTVAPPAPGCTISE